VNQNIRIDKWLWAARFFKVRSLATDATKGGHVLINGVRCKPSKFVSINDEIQIQKGNEHFTIHVTGLASKRGSATHAQTLYQETENSVKQRQISAEQHKLKMLHSPAPDKRPDKRDRRKIQQFKNHIS